MTRENVVLDGHQLTVEQVVKVSRSESGADYPEVVLDAAVISQLKEIRKDIEALIPHKTMYGVNTGCGSNKNAIISDDDLQSYNRKYILAHAIGVGEPLPKEIVRAMMLLRVNSFAAGYSGVRLRLCEMLLELLNNDIVPIIPSRGSVGASGDLIPLSYIGLVLMGQEEAEVFYQGKICNAREVLAKNKIVPLRFQAKEAMALTNGTTMMLAFAALEMKDAFDLVQVANMAAALSLEAFRGERDAFDPRIQNVRQHPGQIAVADQIRRLVDNSSRMTKKAQKILLTDDFEKKCLQPRIQDPYSFRCVPQVHGSTLDFLNELKVFVERELNSVTDNPLIFKDENGNIEVLSGGNFHGQYLAHRLDFLAIALESLANISERRIFRLINRDLSYGLPANLSGSMEPNNTGLMLAQYLAAALVSECKILCHPASVDSIPTSGHQEDFVSMGSISALKAGQVLEKTRKVLSIEMLVACQGISVSDSTLGTECGKLGIGTQKIFDLVRSCVAMIKEDRRYDSDRAKIEALIKNRSFIKLFP